MSEKMSSEAYGVVERGSPFTFDYRVFFRGPSGLISPWHDIPLHANVEKKLFNVVIEISRWSNAKMEICKEEPLNPIKQDVKKGALRFINNVFPFCGYTWNYGALPQTWEDPREVDAMTGEHGDNDPLDVIEIGEVVRKRGSVVQAKVLGALGLIDEGESDWKVIMIAADDPLANKLHDITDVETHLPGLLKATVEWLRTYKVPTGKKPNRFAMNAEFQPREVTLKLVEHFHGNWKRLFESGYEKISCINTTHGGSSNHKTQEAAQEIVNSKPELGPEAPIPSDVHKWSFLHNDQVVN